MYDGMQSVQIISSNFHRGETIYQKWTHWIIRGQSFYKFKGNYLYPVGQEAALK